MNRILAFRNIYSLLRHGGTVFLTFVACAPGLEAYTVLQDMPKYKAYMKGADRIIPPFQNIGQPRRALMSLLTDAGFKVRICSYRAMISYDFETAEHLRAFLLALSPFDTQCLPADLRNEYLEDLTREFLERTIVFYKDHDNAKERCVIYRFSVFVVYLEKPPASYNETSGPGLANFETNPWD